MKTLTLVYLENGKVHNDGNAFAFDGENYGLTVNITVPEGYETYTFVMECTNDTVTKQIALGRGLTEYEFSVDDELSSTGTLEMQLIATTTDDQNETLVVKWQKYNILVDEETNTTVDGTVTKAYVNTQDTATLTAAKDYTDQAIAGVMEIINNL